jgi:endonuclease I
MRKTAVYLLIVLATLLTSSLFSTVLLTDDFTGTVGTLLTANGWTAHSGAGSTPMSIASPGLTYTGYAGSGIGNATSASATGEDVNKSFTAVNSGSVYYSFLVNTTMTTTTAGYAMHFMQNSTTFHGRFWMRLVSGNINFGLAKTTAAATWDPTNYATGTTYHIVLKYTFNTGSSTDDAVYMFVNPTLGGAEPTPTIAITNDTATDATSISMVGIRQYAVGANSRFDGIIVGTAWEDVAGAAMATEPTAQPTSLAFANVTTTSFDVSYTAASPAADNYLAVRKEGSAPTSDPVDGTGYSLGNTLGDGTIAYVGSGTSFSESSLNPSTTYYYKIYSFNGTGGAANYLTTSPLAGSQTTLTGVVAPTVTTASISAITDTSAVSGGTITADGNGSITAKGVCWNTTGSPTLADNYTTDGTGVDAFVSSLYPLNPYTMYYVRAYATNSAGTGYGNEVTFTTLKDEPVDHVTSFAAGTTTSGTIPLTWVDSAADGYLIKGSTVSLFDIVPPVDGVYETNSLLVHNVDPALQTYTFTGLEASTPYYFRIYPYNNSGTNIDYKIDGTVPSVSTATTAASTSLFPGDIAILGVNTDDPDRMDFVALADIPEGTVITFTDNAWLSASGPFNTNEGSVAWTSPAGGVTKGTVVSLTTVTTMSLATGGDNIIAFEGTWAERPTDPNDSRFLYVFATEAFITTGTPTTNQTYVPAALTDYSVAMTTSGTETDNAYFANGSTAQTAVSVTGTKEELLVLFTDASLYYKDDTAALTFPTYTITVGTSGPVTEPTAQPTSLVFSAVGSNSFTVSYTAADPAADGYIAVRRTGAAPTSDPVDGTSYAVGTTLGDGVIAYRGSGTSFSQASLSPSTTYYYKIYSYNGASTSTNYLTTSPLTGSQTTNESDPYGGYYTSVAGLTGAALKAGLHNLSKINHTTVFSYTATTDQLMYTDEDPNNSNNIIEQYTGWSVPKTEYNTGVTGWNKEHTWSDSHGIEGDLPAYSDLHHLRPCDATVNSAKSNYDFDEGTNPYTDASPYTGYSGVTGCYTATNIWEPRDEEKGDIARMMFYMDTRYEGTDPTMLYNLTLSEDVFSQTYGDSLYARLSTLIAWHNADPPSDWERRRNDRIQERQGNRNPFIDHPEYVTSIWGGEEAPSVTTAAITSISINSATGGGEVTSGGSAAVTARGVCWNTTGSPTLSDSHTTDGTGTGVFVSSLTSLSAGTLYYVRAYATNSVGTTYGNEVTFTTLRNEPAAHVTSFTAGTATTTTIPLTWTDSDAQYYLIKGSSVSFAAITDPVDGTAEADGALVHNVNQGVQTYTFTGLTSATTYYFKIYPYNNTGTDVNYKTDGVVPTASATTSAASALLMVENFDYVQGTYLKDNGWSVTGTTVTYPPIVGNENLTYPGYLSPSGLCGETTNNGEDDNKTFEAQTSGDVYCALLVKVTSCNTTGGYIFHFGPNPFGTTDFKSRLFIKSTAYNNLSFGISKAASSATAYTDTLYALNTTYLIVMKYSIIDGAANDEVKMWVNPAFESGEPSTGYLSGLATETDIASVGGVGIRQSSSTLTAKFDGIRVATNWATLFPAGTVIGTSGTLTPFTAIVGTPSASQSYTVTGANLTADIAVTAPTGFQVSLNNSTWTSSVNVPQTGGNANSTVYVRFTPAATGAYSGNITHTSTGATQVDKAVSGSAYSGQIVVTESLTEFSGIAGTPSAAQTYNLTGLGLDNYINVAVTGPYQIMDTTHPSPTWETSLYLAPDYTGDIDVRFNPTEAGDNQLGTITHSSDGPEYEAQSVVINLSGDAISPSPAVAVAPQTLTFSTNSGTSSAAQSVAVTGANLSGAITVASAGEYTFAATEGGTYANPYQITSGYNGVSTVWIKFNPTSIGTFNNTVTFTSGTAADTIDVTGYSLDPSATYATDLFFSEYIEGSSNNKALEIFNGTGHPVDLSNYKVYLYANGAATPGNILNMTGTLANNDVYCITNSSATLTGITSNSDITSSVTFYNGDDALALVRFPDSVYVDIFGRIGNDPGTGWTGDGGYQTWDKTLVRKSTVLGGVTVNPTGTGTTAFTTLTTEWDLYPIDTVTNYGSHYFTPGMSPAEAPQITPPGGIQVGPIMVSMSTTTPGGEIRYTTDGSDPTQTSTLYSAAFEVSATVTIKARTYASGYAASAITTVTYTFPTITSVPDIATLRAQTYGTGAYYKLAGEAVLTLQSSYRHAKYIQDATGAILIDDNTGKITTTYNLGDGITNIIGTLAVFNRMLQFTPVLDPGPATSTGNVITPVEVTFAAMDTTYQAKLVKISNVSFSATGNFAGATNYPVVDGTAPGTVYTNYSDLDYIGTPIPTTPKTIVGVMLQYNATMEFVPRSLAEFTDAAPPDAPINVVITTDGTDMRLDWDDDPTVTSWTVYVSDSPDSGFTQLATNVTSNFYIHVGAASAINPQRFYYVTANR